MTPIPADLPSTSLFLSALALGAGFGVNGSVSPGPMMTLLVSETLTNGIKSSWRVAIASLISDPIAIFVAILTLNAVPDWTIGLIAFLGAAMLFRIAWGQLKTKATDFETQDRPRISLFDIWATNATNPNLWIYAFTVNGLLITQFWKKGGLALTGTYVLAFYGTMIACNLTIAAILGSTRKLFSPKALVVVNRVLGVALILLAIGFVYTGALYTDVWKFVERFGRH